MKSKWENTISKLISILPSFTRDESGNIIYYRWELDQLMELLAEKVEKKTISKMLSSNAKDREVFYSKEQVDALLNSQARECYNKAKIEFIKDDYSNCYVRDYGDFTSMLARVNKDSILNAKLKLE